MIRPQLFVEHQKGFVCKNTNCMICRLKWFDITWRYYFELFRDGHLKRTRIVRGNNMKMIFDYIVENNTEADVLERIDEAIPDYLEDDWETEFDDICEAYGETGRGEAESLVLGELINAGVREFLMPSITDDQYCDLLDKLAAHWSLNTN